jgi:hypothetical protein
VKLAQSDRLAWLQGFLKHNQLLPDIHPQTFTSEAAEKFAVKIDAMMALSYLSPHFSPAMCQ